MRVRTRKRIANILLGAAVFLVLIFLMAPALVVIPLSFAGTSMTRFPPPEFNLDAYRRFFSGPGWLNSTYFSLQMAGAVMVLATVLGTLTAYAMTRLSGSAKRALSIIVLLPIVVPHIIFALAIYGWLIRVGGTGTMTGFIIANLVIALPYAIISIRTGLESLDWSLLRAAATMGARPPRILLKIAFPLLAPSILAAALFSFLVAFDEVVIAQFIGSPFANPLPKRMWDGILFRFDPAISAISTMQIGITVVVLVVLGLMKRRQDRLRNTKQQTPQEV